MIGIDRVTSDRGIAGGRSAGGGLLRGRSSRQSTALDGGGPRGGRAPGRPRRGWSGREEQGGRPTADAGGPVVALYGLGKREELHLAQARPLALPGARGGPQRRRPAPRGGPAGPAETTGRRRRAHPARPGSGRLPLRPLPERAGSRPLERLARGASGGRGGGLPGGARRSRCRWPGAVAFARDLANTPTNEATPPWMEERARELATSRGLELTVLGRRELERPRHGRPAGGRRRLGATSRGWCAWLGDARARASPWSARG